MRIAPFARGPPNPSLSILDIDDSQSCIELTVSADPDARFLLARLIIAVDLVGIVVALCVVLASCLGATILRDSTVQTTERDLRGLTTLLAEQTDRTLKAIEVVEDGLGERLAGAIPGGETKFDGIATAALDSLLSL